MFLIVILDLQIIGVFLCVYMQGAALERDPQSDGFREELGGSDRGDSRRGCHEHEERPVSGTHTTARVTRLSVPAAVMM